LVVAANDLENTVAAGDLVVLLVLVGLGEKGRRAYGEPVVEGLG
jgi:hypothetical protein